MQKAFPSLIAAALLAWPLLAQTTQQKTVPAHPHTASKAKSKAKAAKAAKSSTVAKASPTAAKASPATRTQRTPVKGAGVKTKAKAKANTVRRPVRSYQQAPTPERYQEIQQALAKKGYFQGEANGQWGSDSLDALKRFQADQNLVPDGKLNSLSLIALGLGPKRLTAQSKSAAPTAPPAPAPQ